MRKRETEKDEEVGYNNHDHCSFGDSDGESDAMNSDKGNSKKKKFGDIKNKDKMQSKSKSKSKRKSMSSKLKDKSTKDGSMSSKSKNKFGKDGSMKSSKSKSKGKSGSDKSSKSKGKDGSMSSRSKQRDSLFRKMFNGIKWNKNKNNSKDKHNKSSKSKKGRSDGILEGDIKEEEDEEEEAESKTEEFYTIATRLMDNSSQSQSCANAVIDDGSESYTIDVVDDGSSSDSGENNIPCNDKNSNVKSNSNSNNNSNKKRYKGKVRWISDLSDDEQSYSVSGIDRIEKKDSFRYHHDEKNSESIPVLPPAHPVDPPEGNNTGSLRQPKKSLQITNKIPPTENMNVRTLSSISNTGNHPPHMAVELNKLQNEVRRLGKLVEQLMDRMKLDETPAESFVEVNVDHDNVQ